MTLNSPSGEENHERELLIVRRFLFAMRLLSRLALPANGEGEPPRNAALRAPAHARASTAFRFLPSLLHEVASSR